MTRNIFDCFYLYAQNASRFSADKYRKLLFYYSDYIWDFPEMIIIIPGVCF
jgi:hypothetical protein